MESIEIISCSEVIDSEFMAMEEFGLINPHLNGVRWGGHGENHGGNLLI